MACPCAEGREGRDRSREREEGGMRVGREKREGGEQGGRDGRRRDQPVCKQMLYCFPSAKQALPTVDELSNKTVE